MTNGRKWARAIAMLVFALSMACIVFGLWYTLFFLK